VGDSGPFKQVILGGISHAHNPNLPRFGAWETAADHSYLRSSVRKRTSRPPKFASVSNDAVDSIPSLLSVGMLTRLIRAQDGAHVTVESMTGEYAEGKVLLTKAMAVLVETAHVVKYKIQRAQQEIVEEGGKKVTKNGGSWYTVFDVDSIPFTEDDVREALIDILRNGNARAVRIEPERLDPRLSGWSFSDMQDPDTRSRPAETQDPDEAPPTCRILTVGDPTVGESAALSKTLVFETAGTNTPPPPSSVGPGEDASPEAPLEEDEEMKGNDINPSPEARAHLPQEREGDDEESFASNGPEGLPGGLVDIPGWLATLPGLGDRETAFYGFLEYPVMQALAAGWTLQGLKEHLKPLVNPDLARSKNAVPGWYEKHLSELPEAPKAVVPLCDNPAHALNPKEDPVRGGCFFCNTPAKAVTVVEPVPVTGADGDAVSLGLAFRANLRAKRIERTTEPSRKQMPHHRAADEAERNRVKANDLLRTESGR